MSAPNSIKPTIDAWVIIQEVMIELGIDGPPVKGMGDVSRAEEIAKTITARMAANDPPILLCYPDQIIDKNLEETEE